MHITVGMLSDLGHGLGFLLLILALPLALANAPWRALRSDPQRVHLVAGGALGCLLLWLLNIRIVDGIVLHLLGMTTLTLVVGWSLAVIAGSLALLVVRHLLGLEIAGYPVAWLLTVLVPATVTIAIAKMLYRPGLRNPFFYMLGAGFLGGGLVVLVDATIAGVLLSQGAAQPQPIGGTQLWPLLLLLLFSEGFINGLCISAMAVFFPHWLKTFDEHFYLGPD